MEKSRKWNKAVRKERGGSKKRKGKSRQVSGTRRGKGKNYGVLQGGNRAQKGGEVRRGNYLGIVQLFTMDSFQIDR